MFDFPETVADMTEKRYGERKEKKHDSGRKRNRDHKR